MMPPQRTYTTIALALTALLLTGYASAQSFLSWSEKAQEAQRRKDDAAALDAWSNALQLWREKDGKDKKSQALRSRAEILDKQGDWKRAVQDLCAAASIEPKNAAIFHRRGRIYLDHDQVSDAISDFYKATALRSNFAAAFHDRARAYEIIGDAEFSREDYATACRLGLKEACPQAKTSLASRKLQAARTKTPGPRAQTQSGEMEDELVLPPAPEQPPVLAPDEPAPAAKAPVHSEPTAKAPAPAAPLVLTPDEPTPAAKAPAPAAPLVLTPDEPAPAAKAPAPAAPLVLTPDEPAPAAKAPAPAAPLVLTPDEPAPAAKAPVHLAPAARTPAHPALAFREIRKRKEQPDTPAVFSDFKACLRRLNSCLDSGPSFSSCVSRAAVCETDPRKGCCPKSCVSRFKRLLDIKSEAQAFRDIFQPNSSCAPRAAR